MEEKLDKVFVYGTLKIGGYFDRRKEYAINRMQRLNVQDAFIVGAVMYDLGGYPAITATERAEKIVYGELHTFSDIDSVLQRFDRIEGYRPDNEDMSFYIRKEVDVHTKNGDGSTKAYAYFMSPRYTEIALGNKPILENGVWEIENKISRDV